MGPLVARADLDVRDTRADEPPHRKSKATSDSDSDDNAAGSDVPRGAFPASLHGYADEMWSPAEYRDVEDGPISAWLDLNAASDTQVPRLREEDEIPAEGTAVDDDDDDDVVSVDDDLDIWTALMEAEKEKAIDRSAPTLLVCKGDLRLHIRYQERCGHGDAGCGVAYLLRRAASAGGPSSGVAVDAVSKPCEPLQSWDDYVKHRYRDHF